MNPSHSSPLDSPATRRPLREFADGARDTFPMMVGAAPFGVIFGTLVTAGPLACRQLCPRLLDEPARRRR